MRMTKNGPLAAAVLVLTLAGLTGCADNAVVLPSGSTSGATPLSTGGATVLYALQQPSSGATSLLQYSLSASSGNASPVTTITPPSGVDFYSVATDSAGNIYVGSSVIFSGQGEVLVYAAGSSGLATPVRTIYGGYDTDTTTFSTPYSMAINSAGTLAILTQNGNGNAIVTLPAASNGTPVVTTQLYGASTQMLSPTSLTIDATGKVSVTDVNASNVGTVMTYAAGATGNTAPLTILTTGTSYLPYGVSADASGNLFVALDSIGSSAGFLMKYAAGANGAATPTAQISGSSTGIYFGGGVRTDSVGNVYMINVESNQSSIDFLGFQGAVSGNVGPGLSIGSSALTAPGAEIAVH